MSASQRQPGRPEAEAEVTDHVERSISELMENARLLARRAVETGKLTRGVDVERMFAIRRRFELEGEISERELSSFLRSYQILERSLGPVTVNTLRATEWRENKPCAAANYVARLWWRTNLNIGVILGCHLMLYMAAHDSFTPYRETLWAASILFMVHYLIPFLYGALGADAFLIRETTHKLRLREFDPRRIPENAARFLLGTLSGGVIVLFVNPKVVNLIIDTNEVKWAMGTAALGFLAGYSNDFLFTILERVMRSMSPEEDRSQKLQDVHQQTMESLLERFEAALATREQPERTARRDGVAWSRPPKPEEETPHVGHSHSSVEQLRSG
jgi:hypothetical protein